MKYPLASLMPVFATLLMPSFVSAHPDTASFNEGVFVKTPQVVECTLENGTQTQCQKITVGHLPEGLEIGPFCPTNLDGEGGIWEWTGENAGLYRVDRDFLMMLDTLGYRFFDDDGTVHIADISIAGPVDDHACISVSEDENVEITMLLPLEPVIANTPSSLGTVSKVGVALDGVPIFSDAPSIQATGHMPALDVCGGHIDPGGWYHWHATSSDIETVYEKADVNADCGQTQDSSALFGYAFDGFAIYGSTDADGETPNDLDTCNGHISDTVDDGSEYHYHATDVFPNLPTCLIGVQAQGNFVTTATAGIGAMNAGEGGRNEPPRRDGEAGGMPPGFEEAAEALGVTPEAFLQAMDQAGGRNANLAEVAEALSVSEDRLREVLPQPAN